MSDPVMACRSRDASIENPGNNLYVTGLSARVSKRDLEKHFSNEGKVCLEYVYLHLPLSLFPMHMHTHLIHVKLISVWCEYVSWI